MKKVTEKTKILEKPEKLEDAAPCASEITVVYKRPRGGAIGQSTLSPPAGSICTQMAYTKNPIMHCQSWPQSSHKRTRSPHASSSRIGVRANVCHTGGGTNENCQMALSGMLRKICHHTQQQKNPAHILARTPPHECTRPVRHPSRGHTAIKLYEHRSTAPRYRR